MPGYLLEALSDELPRVEAAAALQRATETALGSGSLSESTHRRLWREWSDEAGAAERPMTPELVRAAAVGMGFQVGD